MYIKNGKNTVIDKKDRKILNLVQQDCRQSINDLAEKVNLSTSACHRRIRQLEDKGIIRGYVAQLDGKKVGSLIEFFVEVSLSSQFPTEFEPDTFLYSYLV